MSLEAKIEALTVEIAKLTAAVQSPIAPPKTLDHQQAAPAPDYSALVPTPIPTPAPQFAQQAVPAAPAPQMPPPPNFMAPPAAPAPQGAPFTDTKGLIDYATQAYGALGAEKGAGIQQIMGSLGVSNVNDIKVEQYGAFYAAVEALKAQ